MFADILRRLAAPEPEQLSDPDARVALGALLVRIAKADGEYAAIEVKTIDQILSARYGIGADEATALRKECEQLEAEAPDTVRFTRAIKDAVVHDDRVAVVSDLWKLVMADGVRDDEEDSIMRMVTSLLGITDQESHKARQQVT